MKLNETYFQNLLQAQDSVEAVAQISSFWAHRLNPNAPRFGLNRAEWHAQLALIYSGEVSNGGHIQYFLNRGDDIAPATIAALTDMKLNKLAEVLEQATKTWNNHTTADTLAERAVAGLAKLDATAFPHVAESDAHILRFLQRHAAQILRPERGLSD